jgi:hypothetical protein
MPLIPFAALPDASRVWVFGSDRPLDTHASTLLLAAVDDFLTHWKAHGAPLTVGRDWREDRFLAIAVDTTQESASGCSIDGLFRELHRLEPELGATLLGGARIFYRDTAGMVHTVGRDIWAALGERGEVLSSTVVFDPTVQTLADWRSRFETTAAHSWHGALLPSSVPR